MMKKSDVNNNKYVIEMLDITKGFPGVKALKGVDFKLKKGEVHGFVGENGAGKSTLMKILMGIYTKDRGRILINNKEVDIKTPAEAHEHGLGMIFQELSLIPQLTVGQNIFLDLEPVRKIPIFINENSIYKKALKLIEGFGINLNPNTRVENLNRAYSQITEILKVIVQDVKIIAMDEPTASLTKNEEETLYEVIKNLKNQGVSIIYISHRLQEIFNICDRVTIFRDGLKIDTKDIDNINMGELVEKMTGKVIKQEYHHKHDISTEDKIKTSNILEVKKMSKSPIVKDVSFNLKYGEILGIVGLLGSGKSEIAKALFGIDLAESGEFYIEGKKINIKNTIDAINFGINLVPEDRRIEGLVPILTVESNLTLPILNNISRFGFIKRGESSRRSERQIDNLSIKTPSMRQEVAYLSGGNQQKVVIGKWLMEKPNILLMDEPSVGIDVNAKAEIRKIISDLVSSQQCSVILFSSELGEVIQLADRIIVLYKGSVFKEFINSPPIEEPVLHHAVQGIS